MCLTSQPRSTNSTASQSSSSGCDGQLALRADVVERPREAAAEEVVPEPVDDDPGRLRVVGPGQPAGQVEPGGPAALDAEVRQDLRHGGSTTGPDSSIQSPRGRSRVVRGSTGDADHRPAGPLGDRLALASSAASSSAIASPRPRRPASATARRRSISATDLVHRRRGRAGRGRRSRAPGSSARCSGCGRPPPAGGRRRRRRGCRSRAGCTGRTCGRGTRRSPSSRPARPTRRCGRGRRRTWPGTPCPGPRPRGSSGGAGCSPRRPAGRSSARAAGRRRAARR